MGNGNWLTFYNIINRIVIERDLLRPESTCKYNIDLDPKLMPAGERNIGAVSSPIKGPRPIED